jgi:hypothetical protein
MTKITVSGTVHDPFKSVVTQASTYIVEGLEGGEEVLPFNAICRQGVVSDWTGDLPSPP